MLIPSSRLAMGKDSSLHHCNGYSSLITLGCSPLVSRLWIFPLICRDEHSRKHCSTDVPITDLRGDRISYSRLEVSGDHPTTICRTVPTKIPCVGNWGICFHMPPCSLCGLLGVLPTPDAAVLSLRRAEELARSLLRVTVLFEKRLDAFRKARIRRGSRLQRLHDETFERRNVQTSTRIAIEDRIHRVADCFLIRRLLRHVDVECIRRRLKKRRLVRKALDLDLD